MNAQLWLMMVNAIHMGYQWLMMVNAIHMGYQWLMMVNGDISMVNDEYPTW